jgi:protein gp37
MTADRRAVIASSVVAGSLPITRQEAFARISPSATPDLRWLFKTSTVSWPLPNVWLGVSAEDQATAAARIPPLLAIPAAVRFVSAEPLLGPINLCRLRVAPDHHTMVDALDGYAIVDTPGRERERAALHWVIVGGESGPGARPMHPDWARSLRDQCATAGVPFFVKQLSSGGPKAIKEIDAFPEGLRVREFPA